MPSPGRFSSRSNELEKVIGMAGVVVLGFVLLVGPLSYFYGVDSRLLRDRGSYGDPRR